MRSEGQQHSLGNLGLFLSNLCTSLLCDRCPPLVYPSLSSQMHVSISLKTFCSIRGGICSSLLSLYISSGLSLMFLPNAFLSRCSQSYMRLIFYRFTFVIVISCNLYLSFIVTQHTKYIALWLNQHDSHPKLEY